MTRKAVRYSATRPALDARSAPEFAWGTCDDWARDLPQHGWTVTREVVVMHGALKMVPCGWCKGQHPDLPMPVYN